MATGNKNTAVFAKTKPPDATSVTADGIVGGALVGMGAAAPRAAGGQTS